MREFLDASDMADAVQKGEISPLELVQDSIRKADALNPKLNAIVSTRYEKALSETQNRDFTGKPFGGVPIFIKDLGQELAGELSTSGSRLFKEYLSPSTDYFVQSLEDLGFIILGKTNTPEFGFKNISDSTANGIVNLPRDLSRNAGGSSGGAAALVAAGVVPLAAASDGGGSIRIPASFNGLIGLKPSRGRIITGPDSYRGWQGASVHFAVTKSVRDTKRLLSLLQVEQLESPYTLKALSEEAIYLGKAEHLKVAYYLKEPDGSELGSDAKAAILEAVAFLKEEGHQVHELDNFPVDHRALVDAYYVMNAVETANMFDKISEGLGREVTKDDMETMTWAIYQAGQGILAKDYSKTLSEWDQFSAQMVTFYDNYDLFLTATTHDNAPKHGQLTPEPDVMTQLARAEDFSTTEQLALVYQMFEKGLALNPYTPIANLTGQTAITLPTHVTHEGLPMGVHFMANKGREDLLLAIAEAFENAGQFKE